MNAEKVYSFDKNSMLFLSDVRIVSENILYFEYAHS